MRKRDAVKWLNASKAKTTLKIFIDIILYMIPASLFIIFGIGYILETFIVDRVPQKEEYMFLLGVLGVTISLATLSLEASRTCRDEKKKKKYRMAGEDLFQSVIIFIFVITLKYGTDKLLLHQSSYRIVHTIGSVWKSIGAILFWFGLLRTGGALYKIHRLLFRPIKDDTSTVIRTSIDTISKKIHAKSDERQEQLSP